MCFSLIAAAVLSGAGSYLKSKKERKDAKRRKKARDDVLARHQQRQKKFADENNQLLLNSLDTFTPEEQDNLRQQQQERLSGQFDDDVNQRFTPSAVLSPNAPRVVQAEAAKRLGDALDESRTRAQNAADLGSFGHQVFQNSLTSLDTGRRINTNNNFASAEAGLLPYQQDLAEANAVKNSGGFGIGSLLTGLGGAIGSASGAGIFG